MRNEHPQLNMSIPLGSQYTHVDNNAKETTTNRQYEHEQALPVNVGDQGKEGHHQEGTHRGD